MIDHRSLIPILNSKALDELPFPRLVHLKENLALYHFTAVWRRGIDHKVVDCFSRCPVDDPDAVDEEADLQTTANPRDAASGSPGHTTGDQILVLLEDPHVARLKEKANRDLHYRQRESIEHGISSRSMSFVNCTHPTRGRTALSDELGRWCTGRESPTTFATWVAAVQRVRNAFRPMPPSLSLSTPPPIPPLRADRADLFQLGGKQFLVTTDQVSGWPTVVLAAVRLRQCRGSTF